MRSRFPSTLWLIGCGIAAGAHPGRAADFASPFVPGPPTQVAASESVDPLVACEFVGVASIAGETSVYLRLSTRTAGQWFRVGAAMDGVLAEQYDPEREAVFVRAGAHARWLFLPRPIVAALPVARLPDGTVDWSYMKLSEKGKETEAMHLMQDIMYASLPASAKAGAKPAPGALSDSATTISSAR